MKPLVVYDVQVIVTVFNYPLTTKYNLLKGIEAKLTK